MRNSYFAPLKALEDEAASTLTRVFYWKGAKLESGKGNYIAVDSLKIRIPIERIEIIDSNFAVENVIVINADTGETINLPEYEKEFKKHSRRFEESGVLTYFAVEKQVSKLGKTAEFLIILFNSKLLESRYFEGLTLANIHFIYEKLIRFNVVSFSFDDFMNGECTDTDLKYDLIYNDDFLKLIKTLHLQTKPSREIGEGGKIFNRKDNRGIQWSKRETTSFKRNPYLKIYNKNIELKCKSSEFAQMFLNESDFENRIRIETTIKNAKHFRYLFGSDFRTSLKNILELTAGQKMKVFRIAGEAHLEPLIKKQQIPEKLRDKDVILFNAVNLLMQRGINFDLLKNELTFGIMNKSQISKKKKMLDNLYYSFLKNSDADKTAERMKGFFDILGLTNGL